jgi:IMP dehydrogenase
MAIAMAREGGIGIIHRNMSLERAIQEVTMVKRAEDLIERDVITVESNATVADVEHLMNQHSISGVPVIENGEIIGIVSRRDVRAIASKRGSENIKKVMTKRPITANEDITMESALELMYTNKVERLPIVNAQGKLIGIITMQDILEKKQYPLANRDKFEKLRVAAAVGPFDFERAMKLDEYGVDALVVDCAHGHNMKVVKSVRDIKRSAKADIVAGNIATKQAAEELVDDVDGLKVGIGPGSICTTRIVAGVGVPQITAIAEVAEIASENNVPVIADGGIRSGADIVKALAAGADAVMIGGLFSGTEEAPGAKVEVDGKYYKHYRLCQ